MTAPERAIGTSDDLYAKLLGARIVLEQRLLPLVADLRAKLGVEHSRVLGELLRRS